MKIETGTILKRKSTKTLYRVIEWSETSNLCLLAQINKSDMRQKVFNRNAIENEISAGKIILKQEV